MPEEVLGEVVEEIDLLFLRRRRVLRFRLAVERIVVVELAPIPRRRGGGRDDDDERRREPSARG